MFHNSYQIPQQPLSRNNCSISFYRELSGPCHCSCPPRRGLHSAQARETAGTRHKASYCAVCSDCVGSSSRPAISPLHCSKSCGGGGRQTSCAVEPCSSAVECAPQPALHCAATPGSCAVRTKTKAAVCQTGLQWDNPPPSRAPRRGWAARNNWPVHWDLGGLP